MSSVPPPQTYEPPPDDSPPDGPRPDGPRPELRDADAPALALWTAPAALALGLCGGVFASIFITLIGTAFGSSTTNPTPAVSLISSLAFDLSFVVAALYFSALRGGLRPADFGYRRTPWGNAITAFVAGGILYYAVSFGYAALLGIHGNDKLPSGFGVHRSTAAMLGTAAFVCVVAPICEEFFFRGFLFGVLCRMRVTVAGRAAGPLVAAVITGILFGLAHTGSVSSSQYLIPLGFLGFVLCIMRWRTGSLYPCMALHSFNNVLAFGVVLNWSASEVLALLVVSWALIAVLTGPLSAPALGRGRHVRPAG